MFGTSQGYYQSTDKDQLAGTGQGSGASLAVWVSICILLLIVCKKNAPRNMKYRDPTGELTSDRNADEFVDDARIGFKDDKKTLMDIITMLQMLKECTKLWENLVLLRRSIGTIEMLLSNDELALGSARLSKT